METAYLLPTHTTSDERPDARVAILPVGSYEQHGPYLPLSTDTIIACLIARKISEAYPVRCVAPITISCSHEHAAWPGTVSVSSRTLSMLIADIQDSLNLSGIRRLVLINAHGGNYVLKNLVQESTVTEKRMALFPTSDDWHAAHLSAGLETSAHDDMHAGELETSILLDAFPELVRDGYQAADHVSAERPHLLTLGMKAYTRSGIIGRPSLATASKGKAVIASLVQSFEGCLQSLED